MWYVPVLGRGSEQGRKEIFKLVDKVYSSKCLHLYIQMVLEAQARNLEENSICDSLEGNFLNLSDSPKRQYSQRTNFVTNDQMK